MLRFNNLRKECSLVDYCGRKYLCRAVNAEARSLNDPKHHKSKRKFLTGGTLSFESIVYALAWRNIRLGQLKSAEIQT